MQPAFQLHLDGGGHLEPGHAGRHAGGHIGRADAGGEGPHRAVGAGVAVGADDAVAGGDDALLRQKRVLNAHLAHVKKVEDVVFVGKVAAAFGLLGALDVLVGHKVVQHNVDLFVVVDRGKPGFLKLVDGNGGGDVVAQHHVQVSVDQLPGLDGRLAAVGGKDLLGHGHSHGKSLLMKR